MSKHIAEQSTAIHALEYQAWRAWLNPHLLAPLPGTGKHRHEGEK